MTYRMRLKQCLWIPYGTEVCCRFTGAHKFSIRKYNPRKKYAVKKQLATNLSHNSKRQWHKKECSAYQGSIKHEKYDKVHRNPRKSESGPTVPASTEKRIHVRRQIQYKSDFPSSSRALTSTHVPYWLNLQDLPPMSPGICMARKKEIHVLTDVFQRLY